MITNQNILLRIPNRRLLPNNMKNSKKMKILYVITKSNWGGAQRYVFDLASAMQEEGHSVSVVLGGSGILHEKLVKVGVAVISARGLDRDISSLRDLRAFLFLWKTFREVQPDAVHLNSSKAGGLGALAARLAGIKRIIFTAHGWPFKEDRPLVIRWLMYVATWFTVLLSHRTIVVSKQDEVLGKHMWLVSKKIAYIQIALKVTGDILERTLAEKRLSFGHSGNTAYKSKYRLVTIAELTKNKGLKHGIDMMKELKKDPADTFTYTIFGEGEEATSLQNYAREQGVAESVYFENMMENNTQLNLSTTASRYLKAFDIFILPSIKEGMPYVLLEAAAAGLPIVATDVVKSMTTYIPNLHTVPPKSGVLLANKVREISLNPNNKPHAAIFSFEQMLTATEKLYNL